MLNLVKINNSNKINFNSLFINTSSLSKRIHRFHSRCANDGNGLIRRNKFEKNALWINQLLGDHKFSDRSNFNGDCPLTQLMEICQIEIKIYLEKKLMVKLSNISALITIGIFKNYKD
jgi:hypothetical protein